MKDSIGFSYKPNIQTHPNNQDNDINVGFTTKKSLCSYNWDNVNSEVFIFKLRNKSVSFVYFIHHQFSTLHLSPKFCVLGLRSTFLHFIHPYINPLLLFKRSLFFVLPWTSSFWILSENSIVYFKIKTFLCYKRKFLPIHVTRTHAFVILNCFPKTFFCMYMATAISKILVELKLVQKHILFPYVVWQSAKFQSHSGR